AESETVLTGGVFQVGETEIHGECKRLKLVAKLASLFGVIPVRKIRLEATSVFHNYVPDAVLKPGGPSEQTLNGSRVRRDNADGGKGNAEGCNFGVHSIEPVKGDLAGATAHVGEDDRGALVCEVIDERVETGRGMDIEK